MKPTLEPATEGCQTYGGADLPSGGPRGSAASGSGNAGGAGPYASAMSRTTTTNRTTNKHPQKSSLLLRVFTSFRCRLCVARSSRIWCTNRSFEKVSTSHHRTLKLWKRSVISSCLAGSRLEYNTISIFACSNTGNSCRKTSIGPNHLTCKIPCGKNAENAKANVLS